MNKSNNMNNNNHNQNNNNIDTTLMCCETIETNLVHDLVSNISAVT